MTFAPHTDEDLRAMLAACGLDAVEDLFAHLPRGIRLERPLDIPGGVSEMEILATLEHKAGRDRHVDDLVCFAGGGAYDHYLPAVVWALAGRSELYTSYTPYQPELSQGVLQALFEYQSMICDLTGLDASNASLYDGPTALVEAANLARAATGRPRVLVSDAVDPRYREVLGTFGAGSGLSPEVWKTTDGRGGTPPLDDSVACVVVQHPNRHGILEPAADLFARAGQAGARAIQIFDPMSLGVLAPPADIGADIAVAEGQGLGNHLNLGGPYLGIIATRARDLRLLPGRIVGETVDLDGARGYVLTLQAREQHIRREKARSNICTNQTLMAIAAAVHLAWLGPDGLAAVGRLCHAKAAYAADALTGIPDVDLRFPDAPFFKEFVLGLPRPAVEVRDRLLDDGYLAGVPLEDDDHALLVAVTERRSREQIDGLAAALRGALR